MVRPIPSTIASDSEDETVRNIEIALQSLNIRSPGTESEQTQNDLNDSELDARAVIPDPPQEDSLEGSLSDSDKEKEASEDEEGAVGFDLSTMIDDTQVDDVFDTSVPFCDASKDSNDFSVSFNLSSPRFRSHSTNLQDSIVSSSSPSVRNRRHSAGETFEKVNNSSPTSQCKGGSPRNSQGASSHSCCSPRSIRVEDSEMLNEGATIYREFLREEFRRRNIQEPPCLNSASHLTRMRANSMADVVRASNQLCFMSDQFARSPMRQWVQEQADSVSLQNLDFNSFSDLLYGLFQEGGVTWERVLVLFFFCADVSIRAFREKLEGQFHDLINWSLQFISGEKFTRWIQENGGWARVLQSSVDQAYKLAIIGFCTLGMLAFAAYLWKNK